MIAGKKKFMHPISETLCQAYEILRSNGQVSFPLTAENKNALDSVVKTVENSYFGMNRFQSNQEKASAYLCHLIKRHALTDGNKRLALMWFQIYCDSHGLKPEPPEFGYDTLVITIEKTEGRDMENTIKAIKWYLFDRANTKV